MKKLLISGLFLFIGIFGFGLLVSAGADLNPTNVSASCNSGSTGVVLSWTNPNTNALEQYYVYRSTKLGELGSIVNPTGGGQNWLGQDDANQSTSYTDTTITNGIRYYYTVRLKTVSSNMSTNNDVHVISCGSSTESSVPASEKTQDQIAKINTKAKLLKEDKLDSILLELNQLRNKVKEQEVEIKYLRKLTTGLQKVTEATKDMVNNFITYGVDDNTKRLGAGERAAVMNSYKSAFNKLPDEEEDLADAIKIANGRWPSERSEQAESKAKAQFKRIYLRDANMDNPNDNAAVTIMAYGLRQRAENRNLDSERNGIKIFSGIYKHAPSTTDEWNIMQAITYSGALR